VRALPPLNYNHQRWPQRATQALPFPSRRARSAKISRHAWTAWWSYLSPRLQFRTQTKPRTLSNQSSWRRSTLLFWFTAKDPAFLSGQELKIKNGLRQKLRESWYSVWCLPVAWNRIEVSKFKQTFMVFFIVGLSEKISNDVPR